MYERLKNNFWSKPTWNPLVAPIITPLDHHRYREQVCELLTSDENFTDAWDHLATVGGEAPGPNGHRLRDYETSEKYELLRCLRRSVSEGKHRPGPVRECRIPKSSGNGTRSLSLRNIEDRLVERAILQAVAPLFTARGDGPLATSSRDQQLAHAEWLSLEEHRRFWVVDDIQDAFTQVPHQRLLDVLRRSLPDAITALIATIIDNDSRRGIPQGSPLSPLLMNIYLDHFLDRPWQKQFPNLTLLRTVDDLLIPCPSVEAAAVVYEQLAKRLSSAAMPLKGSASTAIRKLTAGDQVSWLGFSINLREGILTVNPGERAWRKLEHHLAECHGRPLPALAANQTLLGWIDQAGPCYGHVDVRAAYKRMQVMSFELGFEEIPSFCDVDDAWQEAAERWQKIRARLMSSRVPSKVA